VYSLLGAASDSYDIMEKTKDIQTVGFPRGIWPDQKHAAGKIDLGPRKISPLVQVYICMNLTAFPDALAIWLPSSQPEQYSCNSK
jgi:hypothetical protein